MVAKYIKRLGFYGLLALYGQSALSLNMPKKVNRRLIVKYKEEMPLREKQKALFSSGAFVVKSFDLPKNLEVIEVARGISPKSAMEYLSQNPLVEYVEEDKLLYALFTPPPTDAPEDPTEPIIPGQDPKFFDQWGLNNNGQTGGLSDADINGPDFWPIFPETAQIVIGVIDTGVNYSHPDLKDNIWVNSLEIPNNGLDDDNNGIIDDVHGYNAVSKTGDPMDDHGHGSHCAGIIGASHNNGIGVKGVMPKVKIIPCKFLAADGSGSTSDAIACLNYFLELKNRSKEPVNVFATSNSWGGGGAEQSLKEAIQAHQDAGILFLAAASNDGLDNDQYEMYPANYPLANIISVAATDHKDELADFSNYGKRTVHLGAPGVDILSTVLEGQYEQYSGTSMATPFAAGLAGVIKALNPDFNYIKVKNLLMAGGTPIEALKGKTISGRRIRGIDVDGKGSLSCKDQTVSGRLSPWQDRMLVPVGSKVLLSAININCEKPNGPILVPSTPLGIFNLLDHGKGADSAEDDGMYTTEWEAKKPGRYEFLFPENDKVVINVYDIQSFKEYKYVKENEFKYRSITGTKLDADDDWTGNIVLPFSINFADGGASFDSVTIGSNGAISLTDTASVEFMNTSLPNDKFVSFIAPFWDDLTPETPDGGIYYDVIGKAPNRELVIEWKNIKQYASSDTGSFQVVLFEDSSDILFNYLDVDFGNDSYNNGANATVGVQSTKDKFTLVSFNQKTLGPKTTFRFYIP